MKFPNQLNSYKKRCGSATNARSQSSSVSLKEISIRNCFNVFRNQSSRKMIYNSFSAERQQSLGFDWHPECLRCDECGKRLNPGQHAEHKGVSSSLSAVYGSISSLIRLKVPYCHVPCYGALFGPQLFGHGTRVESHKSFGQKAPPATPKSSPGPTIPRNQIEAKLKTYNQFYDSKSLEVKSREVNGRLVLEGALRIYWGIQGVIHLKEDDDQRTVVTIRKRHSVRYPNSVDIVSSSSAGSSAASDSTFNHFRYARVQSILSTIQL